MNIYTLISEKIVSKAPHAFTWLIQALFAAAMPEVYQKMPQHLVLVYLGLTPRNLNRLKFLPAAFIATVFCYVQQMLSNFDPGTGYRQQQFKCCTGH